MLYFPVGIDIEVSPQSLEDSGFVTNEFSDTSTALSPSNSEGSTKSKKYNHVELSRLDTFRIQINSRLPSQKIYLLAFSHCSVISRKT